MKLLTPTLALFLLATPVREGVELVYAPEEGLVLKRLFVADARYRLTDMSASLDGEALESDGELPDYGMGFTERIAVTDTLESVEDGRPTVLLRHFDELSQENVDTFEGEDQTTEHESPLEGRSVRFSWDADEERYGVEAADEGDLDEELAAWLAEDLDLRLVLPPGEVEPGDEWELEPELYLAFMWPSGLLDFHPEGAEPSEDDRGPSRQTIERLEGGGTARLEEVREEDGVRVAVIHVELEITTGSESSLPALEGDEESGEPWRPEVKVEVEIERTIEGTILWDLEHGHALSAELECEASRLFSESWTISGEDEDGEDVSADVEQSRLIEGSVRYRATIERE
jgi:hypothetical protein